MNYRRSTCNSAKFIWRAAPRYYARCLVPVSESHSGARVSASGPSVMEFCLRARTARGHLRVIAMWISQFENWHASSKFWEPLASKSKSRSSGEPMFFRPIAQLQEKPQSAGKTLKLPCKRCAKKISSLLRQISVARLAALLNFIPGREKCVSAASRRIRQYPYER